MAHQGLVKNLVAFEAAGTPGAAVNGAGVDMKGWDVVAFVCALGVMGNGGTFDLRVVESANANFSGAVNVAGASVTQVANTSPNVALTIEVTRPTNRYLRVVATPATNNANIGIVSIRSRAQGRPPIAVPTNHQYVNVTMN